MKVLLSKRNIIYVFVFVMITPILILYLNQCGGTPQPIGEGEYRNISSDELKAMMEDKDFSLINVHIPYDGEIPETDMFISYTEIGEKLDLSKDSKIVLYCRSGSMSKTAVEKLVELGYTNVFNLENGMIEWQQEGNQLLFQAQTR
jgi:rhodanese-related sulfurtransferase